MPGDAPNDSVSKLSDWRQGDIILWNGIPFQHLADVTQPITDASKEFANATASDTEGDTLAIIGTDVPGFVVLTQTCDLVRNYDEAEFVQLAALREVDLDVLSQVRKGMRIGYAYLPALEKRRLVADLNRVMTVEKPVLEKIPASLRQRGFDTDQAARIFAAAIGRKSTRAAFPDTFVAAIEGMRRRIREKHGKQSPEGKFLQALYEIRVVCHPAWDADQGTVTFYFIFPDGFEIPANAVEHAQALLDRFNPLGSLIAAEFEVVRLDEMSAASYLRTQPLDLDYLSDS